MTPRPLTRIRKIALALPEAVEQEAWSTPTFRVRKKIFAMFAYATDHHGGGRHAIWVKAAPGNQELMVKVDPDRYFSPPYVGPSGWIGVHLDGDVDWDGVADLVVDAYRLIAPKKLVALMDSEAD